MSNYVYIKYWPSASAYLKILNNSNENIVRVFRRNTAKKGWVSVGLVFV